MDQQAKLSYMEPPLMLSVRPCLGELLLQTQPADVATAAGCFARDLQA